MNNTSEISKRGRTIVFRKCKSSDPVKWTQWLEDNCIASAGPNPSLTGMRNRYWGREALVVRAGAYLYMLALKDDGRQMPWEV